MIDAMEEVEEGVRAKGQLINDVIFVNDQGESLLKDVINEKMDEKQPRRKTSMPIDDLKEVMKRRAMSKENGKIWNPETCSTAENE
ncbi:hypothetical protein CHS0354_014698 [Potamilus streckersoni]|uniref:Uncharacterized protein n=1 Tax=Potamilus streckersoni TaxID=2493646 RepID=A0AAE0VZT5_9BIVA|nr:hypothetical protein CHS0354_014698 [Potamilus streckersoni]